MDSRVLKESQLSNNPKETTAETPNNGRPNNRVAYICNDDYLNCCNELPKVKGRASMVHSLISAYDLRSKLICVNPVKASLDDLSIFHSVDYLQCLLRLSNEDDDEKWQEEAEMYGLTYDCPAYPGVFEHGRFIAGASMKAAQSLLMGIADVAINWGGGWHHAKRDEASGFCYINDAVLAILKLRQKFERVLYVDIDLHHGDGVEDACCATSKVMTVSFHKASPGFFPGTGYIEEVGMSKGKYYTINVPLKDGATDQTYTEMFKRVMSAVKCSYDPQAVVCQCGADGLVGDPMASYNLTLRGMGDCVRTLLDWKLPTLLLGGGGYNLANTARCWTYLTAVALGQDIDPDIPEHQFFTKYGPDYELHIEPNNRNDLNDRSYMDKLMETIKENLEHVKV